MLIMITMDILSHILGHSGVDIELNQNAAWNSVERSCDNSLITSREHSLILRHHLESTSGKSAVSRS